MKLIILAVTLMLTANVFAVPNCKILVDDTVRMPNGPERFPFSYLEALKEKGYKPAMVDYPLPKVGELVLRTNIKCGLSIFNPFLSTCEARATIENSEHETLAEGVSSNSMSFGVYAPDLFGAMKKLPKCADL